MAWVRLADDFYDHPKVLSAGPPAAWLWICGLAYANRYLTDGFLPAAAVRRLTDLEDPFRLAAKLVDVGLFEAVDGGYRIHDYAEYQPSAGEVKDQRQKTAERVAAWRDRHRNAVTAPSGNGVGNARTNAAPGPGPDPAVNPDPAGTTSPLPPPPAEGGRRRGGRRNGGAAQGVGPPLPSLPPCPHPWRDGYGPCGPTCQDQALAAGDAAATQRAIVERDSSSCRVSVGEDDANSNRSGAPGDAG